MAIAMVLASLEGVPEILQTEYKKGDDGKYYLDVTGADDHPAKLPVVRKNRELLEENAKLKDRVKAFDGIEDPEAARTALARLPELEEQVKEAGAGAEKIAQIQKDAQAKIEAAQRKAAETEDRAKADSERARRAARDYFRRQEITRAILEEEGEPEFLMHLLEPETEVVESENGEFLRLKVLDGNKVERILDAKGTPFSVRDRVAELKADQKYGRAFKPNGTSGGGGGQPGGGGDGGLSTNPWKKETLNVTEQMRLAKKNPALARQLAAAAGVTLQLSQN